MLDASHLHAQEGRCLGIVCRDKVPMFFRYETGAPHITNLEVIVSGVGKSGLSRSRQAKFTDHFACLLLASKRLGVLIRLLPSRASNAAAPRFLCKI